MASHFGLVSFEFLGFSDSSSVISLSQSQEMSLVDYKDLDKSMSQTGYNIGLKGNFGF